MPWFTWNMFNCDAAWLLNGIFNHKKILTMIGWVWTLYSFAVMYNFISVMNSTMTSTDREAFVEAGTLAAIVGNFVVTFCLTLQFSTLWGFKLELCAQPSGSGLRRLRDQTDEVVMPERSSSEDGHPKTQETTLV
jgi:hypothetical protein